MSIKKLFVTPVYRHNTTLFNKTDLENIKKILISENEKDKVLKIYKNLNDSVYLA
jgi:hypothetical protein